VVLDCETTVSSKGNPFDARNHLCYIGCFDGSTYNLFDIEYSNESYRKGLVQVQSLVNSFDLLIGFNLKFDLHWIRRYGIDFSKHSVWDCQLVQFILDNQATPYPSLDGVAAGYGLDSKLSVVNDEYWSKGVDTPEIPRTILEDYLKQDLLLTWQIYQLQLKEIA